MVIVVVDLPVVRQLLGNKKFVIIVEKNHCHSRRNAMRVIYK